MRRRHLAGLLVIAVFVSFVAITYRNSLTPYVTFSQARNLTGSVQVKGTLADNAITADGANLRFQLRDDHGEVVTVVYRGTAPDGLHQATGIVAIGKYEMGQFTAEKLLVKCPSKYQGSGKKS